jgi:hypothetical protein
MRGRTGNGWAGPQPRPHTPRKSGNYIGRASANPKLPAACKSAVPPFGESWEKGHEKTQERPCPGRPDSQ